MEIVIALGILVFLIVVKSQISDLSNELKGIKGDLDRFMRQQREREPERKEERPPVVKPVIIETPKVIIETPPAPQVVKEEDKLEEIIARLAIVTEREEQEKPKVKMPMPQTREPVIDSWLKNNPDLEKFIGENLINKIGIAVLVLGIAFFVKYAIDQNWINEAGRVAIGLLCGGILIGIAHWMRNSYRSFSSVLVGGGITIFYFTIAFAFHQYHLMGQTTAFVVMVVITAFAVALSVLYDRLELAIIASVGGFITPFLVSTGQGNYVVLFSYLAILNTGLIGLAFFKRWKPLNFIAFYFTLFIYGGWLGTQIIKQEFPAKGALLFATIFYFMFLIMNTIRHATKREKMIPFDFIMLLVANLAYYTAGLIIMENAGYQDYRGLFTAGLGLINLSLAFAFYRREGIDKTFIYLLIGLTLSFISLAAPVQLKGNHITLFWSAEIAILYWLYLKSDIKLLKLSSFLITVLTIISLLMDWRNVYFTDNIPGILWNKGFTTSLFTALAFLVVSGLYRKDKEASFYGIFYLVAAIILSFVAGLIEINYQFVHYYPETGLNFTYLQLYVMLFASLSFILLNMYKIEVDKAVKFAVAIILFGLYTMNIANSYSNELNMLSGKLSQLHFIAHWVSVAALAYILVYAGKAFIENNQLSSLKNLAWVLCISFIIILSVEVRHIYMWIFYNAIGIEKAEQGYSRAGLSIVWGITSFIIIWLGIRKQYKTLRVIGLVLFALTLLKLFAYDIQNISPGGKILAFILLGVLLLTVSFMYQRVKKILIDDEKTA
jgi:uncharacterized membrane protein